MDGKIKLIIASILKPIDDTRAYEKMGRSLAQTNKYEVNIIGFESKKRPQVKNISLWPIYNANRKHLLRFLAPLKLLKICIKVKPKVLIVNTPELLLVSYLYKIIFGTKIVYDIRENYEMNLSFDATYRKWQKPILKLYLKITEGLTRQFITHYFLAESIYAKQLKFIPQNAYTILENKTAISSEQIPVKAIQIKPNEPIKFIISGTLGKSYGTLEGLSFFQRLKEITPNSSLHIIGYAADQSYKAALQKACEAQHDVHLVLEEGPIAHQLIISAIKEATVALLPYQLNENLSHRIPTKIYDYLALHKPMLIPENEVWNKIIKAHKAGFAIDFEKAKIESLFQQLTTTTFYPKQQLQDIYWKSEEIKFLQIIESLT